MALKRHKVKRHKRVSKNGKKFSVKSHRRASRGSKKKLSQSAMPASMWPTATKY